MSEMEKLRDVGDAFERELLASARGDRMALEKRAALVALVTGGAEVAAGGMHAKELRSLSKWPVKWIGLASFVGAIVAGGMALTPMESGESGAASRATRIARAEHAKRAEADGASDVQREAPHVALPATPPQAKPALRADAKPAPIEGAAEDASSLAAELRLVEQARSALAADRPREALAALAAHRAAFPRGVLGDEAEVLRVDATARAGDAAKARDLGRAFLAAHPSSPYAARVRSIVAAGEAP